MCFSTIWGIWCVWRTAERGDVLPIPPKCRDSCFIMVLAARLSMWYLRGAQKVLKAPPGKGEELPETQKN